MKLFKNGGFVANDFNYANDDAELSAAPVFVSLNRFLAEREALKARANSFGVRLEPQDDVASLAPYLSEIKAIAITFPKYTDGRGYSQARLLRERFDYGGEIRATGNVLIDQVHFMLRCGIDALELENPHTIKALEQGDDKGVTLYYQSAALKTERQAGTRPWLRTAAKS